MKDLFIEELEETRKNYETATLNIFSDGTMSTDDYFGATLLAGNSHNNKYALNALKDGTAYFCRLCDFDTVRMSLILGLVYKIKDVDENFNLKEGAQPIYDRVRFCTNGVTTYLDGKITNDMDINDHLISFQGFLKYSEFIKYVNDNGLTFEGPNSFEELRDKILNKEQLDIGVSAKLYNKASYMKLTRKK